MDYSAAAPSANYSTGHFPVFTSLTRRIKNLESRLQRTNVAVRIAGSRNSVADALARYASQAP